MFHRVFGVFGRGVSYPIYGVWERVRGSLTQYLENVGKGDRCLLISRYMESVGEGERCLLPSIWRVWERVKGVSYPVSEECGRG
jgi:hypothetical protein